MDTYTHPNTGKLTLDALRSATESTGMPSTVYVSDYWTWVRFAALAARDGVPTDEDAEGLYFKFEGSVIRPEIVPERPEKVRVVFEDVS